MYILDVRIRTSCEVLIVLMDSLIGLYRLEARVGLLINIVFYPQFDMSTLCEKHVLLCACG